MGARWLSASQCRQLPGNKKHLLQGACQLLLDKSPACAAYAGPRAQALGAPVGRPTIRKGLPSTGHLHHGLWVVRKASFTEVSAAGLVCPLVMRRRPNFLTFDAVGNRPLLSAWLAGHCS